ncbi:MAG: hypothetical protein WKG07_47525 [Hymenobacter sp.]
MTARVWGRAGSILSATSSSAPSCASRTACATSVGPRNNQYSSSLQSLRTNTVTLYLNIE